MAVTFTWEVDKRSLDDLRRKTAATAGMPNVAKDGVQKFVKWYGGKIVDEARRLAPSDSKKLSRSVKLRQYPGPNVFGRITANHYAQFVLSGTKPHWPPMHALQGWARRHGIPVFLVARKIAMKGTKAQPFFRDALANATTRDAARGLKQLGLHVESEWGRG